MERKFSLSEMNYLLLLALIELEGYGLDAYLSYVKDEGKGLEGIEVLDSDEKVEEMLDLFAEKKVLNITVREASDPNPADANMDHTLLEEQIPMSQVGDPIVYSVSQEGVLFPVSNSSEPPVVPVDPYFNTQSRAVISTREKRQWKLKALKQKIKMMMSWTNPLQILSFSGVITEGRKFHTSLGLGEKMKVVKEQVSTTGKRKRWLSIILGLLLNPQSFGRSQMVLKKMMKKKLQIM